MSSENDILIRKDGKVGRITLNRPGALNALTYEMCRAIDAALIAWADMPEIAMVVIDATGEKAFCAGGDIAEMYVSGMRGDFQYGQRFWRDEYRMNARLFEFPKPVASFLQGFVMGGGVGVGCHGSHRVVGESSRIAMPEVGIGLVPDVGGSLLLARAPGRLGEYLGVTGSRMAAGDAIHAGFADYFIPEEKWPEVISALAESGDWQEIDKAATPAPESALAGAQSEVDALFGGETLGDVVRALEVAAGESAFAADALKTIRRNAPLSMAATVEIIHRLRGGGAEIRRALELEYRFTSRSMEQADFLEGIRAAIIDKDRSPKWRHSLEDLPAMAVTNILLPLSADEASLTFEET